ncbi:MAG: 4Fe-4S cluster-binding domain-containing protein [Asgard group archaeon]|nr:4Fe-4S cluster-binding domain-containing protein [Asgard group archaeon]
MNIIGLDFLLTFKCTAKCLHCCNNAGPELSGVMNYKDAVGYLHDLTATQEIQNIVIHGGEPTLYINLLGKIIGKAKDYEIPKRGIITNCYWAHDLKFAKKRLEKLQEAGLNQLILSADYFHSQFVPQEYVRNIATLASKMQFDKIYIDSYFIGSMDTENKFNNVTREIIQKLTVLQDLPNVVLSSYVARFIGRVSNLVSYVETKDEIPSGKCPLPHWIGGDLASPTTIEIDHSGNVTLCPGICLGNTKDKSVTNILDNYDCEKHPILSILNKEGPIGLLELAKDKGYEVEKKFVDECHLCYEMRKELREFYPKELAPKSAYIDK